MTITGTVVVNTTRIFDNDGDTGVKTEPSADLDRVDIYAATATGADNAIEVTGDDAVASSLNNPYIKVLKHIVLDTDVRIQDAVSGNTYIEMTDSGDLDKIKFVAGGGAILTLDGQAATPHVMVENFLVFPVGAFGIADTDFDTGITFEETSDIDEVRVYAAGSTVFHASATELHVHQNITLNDTGATVAGAKIGDEDIDTYIQFNQATGGTDDDTIRMYAGGTEVVNITATTFSVLPTTASFGVGSNLGAGVTTFPVGGSKGVNIAEGTRPSASDLNADQVFVTAVANIGYSGQSDLYFDFKDGASSKKTVILGEDCTFPNNVVIGNNLTITNNASITGNITLTGFVYSGNGSEATPEYSFAADTDTGFSRAAPDIMQAITGGSQRLQISSSGLRLLNGGGIDTESGGPHLKTKVIEIGDWDMDVTITLNVLHGLTLVNIRGIQVIIRNDANTVYNDINMLISTGTSGGGVSASASTINMVRVSSGYFDTTDYDSTSYNRGWITILYEA